MSGIVEFVGLSDCNKILIEYTDPTKDRLNRILVYERNETGTEVKITGEVKPGLKPGDFSYYKFIKSGNKNISYENDEYSNFSPPLPISQLVWELNYQTLIDGEDETGISLYPVKIPITQINNPPYVELYDFDNGFLGDFYLIDSIESYISKVIVTYNPDGVSTTGEQLYYTTEEFIETSYPLKQTLDWYYCDEFGNKLEDSQTEIKVFEKNENDEWIEVKSWVLSGDRMPLKAECEAECEEDCIPLYDSTGTYRICLCEPKYGDARDTTFPNLDADEWPFYGD